jgi:NAD(P)-dependent dehydrogenase (short-subunit alcohol dehydrogenase family)
MSDEGDEGTVALVTGGGRGIGRAIVAALAERGWRLVINYYADSEAAAEALALAEEAGSQGVCVQADVADAADRLALVKEALAEYGRIDLLVNNAGIAPPRRWDILEVGEESYDRVMAVNLKGPFFLTQMVARRMIEQTEAGDAEGGTIINIGSVSAYAASLDRAEYCLSKAGLGMMTALYAGRLAPHGIGVYEIRPGIVRTDMTAAAAEKYDRLIEQGLTPIRRWGRPEDVARAVIAIVEGRLPFSTGEVINVDGGFHLRRL